jgi:hypothetical protein
MRRFQASATRPPGGSDGDAYRLVELAGTGACLAILGQGVSLGTELEHALVACVDDPHVAVRIDGDAPRSEELQGLRLPLTNLQERAAPGLLELEAGVELLDAVVPGVGHVDVALAVHGHAPGLVELALSAASTAECAQEVESAVELLNAVVAAVGHVDVPFGVDGHAGGAMN